MAQSFVGEHDFYAFMASGSEMENTVRTIYSFSVERKGDLIVFSVKGNGFLYNMVRIMVGTLIWGDMGKLEASIDDIIISRNRTLAGITVPPQGLYLETAHFD
jgi:tRNA pseudouridine38-40 synthase